MALARLAVHLYGDHVADVIDAGFGECAIQYTDRGQAIGAGARLSISLPVRSGLYNSTTHGTRWVRSLLPEGRALSYAITQYGVPEDDRFALLSVLGRDIAGALVIYDTADEGRYPDPQYEPLSRDEVVELVDTVRDRPLGLDRDRGVRLSLAGMQDKLLLHRPTRSRVYYRPLHGAPSTYILKPPPPPTADDGLRTPGLVANEAFCLHLAAAVRLPTAECRVERFGDNDTLVVRRFDRDFSTNPVGRLHQEDLVAAMGRDPHLKYERSNEKLETVAGGFAERRPIRSDPGPTLDDIADLLRRHVGSGSLLRLAEIVTFNVAIGNADAHARNLSVALDRDGGVRLAPLYDLVATRYYDGLASDAAQSVDGVVEIDSIRASNLVAHGARWGLPEATVRTRVGDVLKRIEQTISAAVESTVRSGAEPNDVEGVAEFIRSRVTGLLDDF